MKRSIYIKLTKSDKHYRRFDIDSVNQQFKVEKNEKNHTGNTLFYRY
jgi:hypothetical protein